MSDKVDKALKHLKTLSEKSEADEYICLLRKTLNERDLEMFERALLLSDDSK